MISIPNNESPLHISVSHGHLEFTCLLLDHGPELAVEVDAFKRTPLHLAAIKGYTDIIRVLLEKNKSACLAHDKKGLIPLHYAMIKERIDVIQELIKARPQSLWTKLQSGQTILHLCVKGNHLEGLKFLTEMAAKHNKDFLNAVDDAGNTILDMSMKLKKIEMVRYLLSVPDVKINSVGRKKSLGSKKKKSKNSVRERQEQERASSPTKKKIGCWNMFKNNLKYKGNWVQEVQGIMMLVATVIAAVAFQAGINPPGGVWQQDTPYNSTNNHHYNYYNYYSGYENGYIFPAGTAIMSYREGFSYSVYVVANTVSFMTSASVIMLIISRFPLKNRICSMLLALSMFMAVFFLTIGYMFGVILVTPRQESISKFIPYNVWIGIVWWIGLWHFLRILVWVVKRLWRIFSSMYKLSKCFNITTPPTR